MVTKKQILSKEVFAIYGLGNVGGSIAAVWLRHGAKVIGVDISKSLLTQIKNGSSHKKEPFLSETFSSALKKKSLILTSDGIDASKNSTVKIIVVPVGLKNNKADLKAVVAVAKNIGKGLKKADTVILSPSVPPGTSEKIVLPILEKESKLKAERDFFLIYNPERIFEGRAVKDIEENYPAIISGYGSKSLKKAEILFKIISKKGVLKMPSLSEAEAEKLFEGAYRDVNIALANELADYCEKIGINYWDTRKAANSQPFCHLHYPGTGVGGLCIPVYPRIIIEDASKIGKTMHLLQYSRKINDSMPKKCVEESIKLLSKNKIKPKNAKIAVLGLGFRGEVTDTRLSPTYDVVNEFLKNKCKVIVHDPYIFEDKKLPTSVPLTKNILDATKNANLIFVSSDHKIYSKLSSKSFSKEKKLTLFYDGRNILNPKLFSEGILNIIGIGKN
ncbi:MAG: nucleotide sugar dehydrogenase [Candidatus Nitrosopumilus sp. bin_6a]